MIQVSSLRGVISTPPKVSIALACAVALMGASAAHAGSFYFPGGFFPGGDSGVTGYDNSNIPQQPAGNSTAVTGTVLTGGNRLTPGTSGAPTGPDILAWCVDLSHDIYIDSTVNFNVLADTNSTTASYFSTLYSGANGAATIQSLEHLASNSLGSVNSADTSAAFQIAMWDIAFGFTPGSANAIQANGANATAVNQDVTNYLGNLSGAITEQLVFLQDDGTNGGSIQNLATFTPVPLPAPVWFLGTGLAGLAALARRRKPVA